MVDEVAGVGLDVGLTSHRESERMGRTGLLTFSGMLRSIFKLKRGVLLLSYVLKKQINRRQRSMKRFEMREPDLNHCSGLETAHMQEDLQD
jgi:hypothetical protein